MTFSDPFSEIAAVLVVAAVIGALALGMAPMTAFYVAAALTFSSTVIIIKLLLDKQEIDALHGRILLGILITPDIEEARGAESKKDNGRQ